eukprot:TRINITY_DN8597_c0_g5_i1.p1 TRINITY_DN8597_c0_g5~~TRINITY_DN8597_c0_g5_i1.p1  ORF type:complete len:111 (-),score=20.80 TRINITY_DN8597_c0_g5_i1:102-434(-)
MRNLIVIALIVLVGAALCSEQRVNAKPANPSRLSKIFEDLKNKVRKPRTIQLLTAWRRPGPGAYPRGSYPKDTSNYPFYPKSGACCCGKHPGTGDCVHFGNYREGRGCVC